MFNLYPSILRISFSEGTDGSECNFILDGPERKSKMESFVRMNKQDAFDFKSSLTVSLKP